MINCTSIKYIQWNILCFYMNILLKQGFFIIFTYIINWMWNEPTTGFLCFHSINQNKTCYKMAPTLGLTPSRWQQYIGTNIKYSGRIQSAGGEIHLTNCDSTYMYFEFHLYTNGRDQLVNYLCTHELTRRSKWTTYCELTVVV